METKEFNKESMFFNNECPFCRTEIKNFQDSLTVDVHALIGIRVRQQFFSNFKYQESQDETSIFTPVGKMKVAICESCINENNNLLLKELQKKKRNYFILSSSLFIIGFILLSFLFGLFKYPQSLNNNFVSVVLFVVGLIAFYFAFKIFIGNFRREIKFKFSEKYLSSENFKSFILSMNKKITIGNITFSTLMFNNQKENVINKKANSEYLLYVFDFDNTFFNDNYAWFKYGGRFWYKKYSSHYVHSMTGINYQGNESIFYYQMTPFNIEPVELVTEEILYGCQYIV